MINYTIFSVVFLWIKTFVFDVVNLMWELYEKAGSLILLFCLESKRLQGIG